VKKPLALAVAALAVVAACEGTSPTSTTPLTPTASSQARGEVGQPELVMLGAQSVRGYAGNPNKVYGNMTLHNGNIMPSSVTYAIFWGPGWNTNSTFTADKLPGIASFLTGFGGSHYVHASTEYNGVNGQFVGTSSTYMGQFVDNAAAPSAAPQVSAVQSEVCKVLSANGVAPRSDAVYNVYATTPRGGAGYCAWHSYGSCNGVAVQFAWYFNLDGDSGCNPGTPYGSYTSGHTNSQGLAAIANVTAHEVSETITDPRNGGWYDAGNGENADKCAWSFSPNNSGLVTLSNSSTWRLQMEWSNAAFSAGTGYANRHAQNACLDGIVKY